jgi:excisionase family DNA binding protein
MDELGNRILTPVEVAEIFGVNPKTVTRWARSGQLKCLKTLGGHRRYRFADVEQAIKDYTYRDDTPLPRNRH